MRKKPTNPRSPAGGQIRTTPARSVRLLIAAAATVMLFTSSAAPSIFHKRKHNKVQSREPHFSYAGGTADIPGSCSGVLQLTSLAMEYKCAGRTVSVPYHEISVMQYRSDISRDIWKMEVAWKLKPPEYAHGKVNRYFTLVYESNGAKQVLVLDVPPDEMRPYLAEVELKTNQRVDVERHDDYE